MPDFRCMTKTKQNTAATKHFAAFRRLVRLYWHTPIGCEITASRASLRFSPRKSRHTPQDQFTGLVENGCFGLLGKRRDTRQRRVKSPTQKNRKRLI